MPKKSDREEVYDEQIHPLMEKVYALCEAHGVPMIALFEYEPTSISVMSLEAGSPEMADIIDLVHEELYTEPDEGAPLN